MKDKMKKPKLQRDIYARTPYGFQENIQHMEKEGYSKQRAVGTAFGEADLSYDQLLKRFKNQ